MDHKHGSGMGNGLSNKLPKTSGTRNEENGGGIHSDLFGVPTKYWDLKDVTEMARP